MTKKQNTRKDIEEEVWSAISAFEQILEAMPNDRASLEALAHAYEQIGDLSKAKNYQIQLGKVLLNESDIEAATHLAEKMEKWGKDDLRVNEFLSKLNKVVSKQLQITDSSIYDSDLSGKKSLSTVEVNMGFNMAEELSFAWNLMEANEITQEEYAGVAQDLTEMSAGSTETTVSVLHALEARGFKKLEKIINFVSKDCGVPIIFLSSFDFPPETMSILPLEFMMHRGVFVFDLVSNDALVVVMNPYDTQLRKDIEILSGRKCHFFISLPSEFDKALDKILDIHAEAVSGDE